MIINILSLVVVLAGGINSCDSHIPKLLGVKILSYYNRDASFNNKKIALFDSSAAYQTEKKTVKTGNKFKGIKKNHSSDSTLIKCFKRSIKGYRKCTTETEGDWIYDIIRFRF